MDAVTCRDRHWYDVIFGILLIASGITYAIFDVSTYGIGASSILTIPLMIILCIVGIDFIGSHFFRQISVSEEEVIYRNALGRETRLPWEQVEVDYKPRGPKREERFLFMTGDKTWVFTKDSQNFDELKRFLLHMRLNSIATKMQDAVKDDSM